jgi:predicted metal-dependent phosphoesterase TrpH
MHAHTREHSSCSRIGAVELVRGVIAKGLDGLLLTDHHYLWPQEEIEELRRAAGAPDSFLLSSGQEVTTSDAGDVLVYGAHTSMRQGLPLSELRRSCPGSALVWAHPWRWRKRPTTAELFNPDLDAIEVLNSNHSFLQNRRALREWSRWGFVATGGTDVHGRIAGTYPTIFEDTVKTLADVVEAIWMDKCRPFLNTL